MGVTLTTRPVKKNGGGISYLLNVSHSGKRYREFLGIHVYDKDNAKTKREKRELAEQIRSKRHLELEAAEYQVIPKHKRKTDFFQYWQHFLDTYKGKDHRLVRYSLEKFKKYRGDRSLQAKDVTKKVCSGYARYLLKDAGLNGETPYNYWMKFKRVLNRGVEDGLFRENPAKGVTVKRKIGQLKKEILGVGELRKLSNTRCGNEAVRRAFLFACYTGLGIAEIRKLTWARIANGKIRLFREKNGEQIINDISPVALALAGEPGKASEDVFPPLPSDPAISKVLKRWVKAAGIERNVSFYCGRHTFAVMLLESGADLKTVADCMGHSSTQHTAKYLAYADRRKQRAIQNLPTL